MSDDTGASFYDEVGGHDTFVRLVDAFYRGVAADEVLKPMYPEDDLGPAAERLTLFLEQYWGGPTTYSETRGHPRKAKRPATAGTIKARKPWETRGHPHKAPTPRVGSANGPRAP